MDICKRIKQAFYSRNFVQDFVRTIIEWSSSLYIFLYKDSNKI
jgi:hypothetical protein